ncbi:MAG: alpha/beta hydrolase [Aureispira sp.]
MGILAERILLAVFLGYVLICLLTYWWQERLLFHPTVLAKDFVFSFDTNFEERYLEVAPDVALHALHFKAESPKGLVFYVHGNAGSLQDWGGLGGFYLEQGYDLLMFDYRGFGKSPGHIHSEQQFFDDVKAVYEWAKEQYAEEQIIIQGFSIGTATATKLAAENNPQQLVLKAPYYSMTSLVKSKVPFLPKMLLKYPFKTINYLQQVTCPVTIFHGTRDELIPHSNAERLKKDVPSVNLWLIEDCLHNDIPYTSIYKEKMKTILKQ